MRKFVRRGLWIVGSLAAILLAVVAAVFFLVDAQVYRDVLESRLEASLGRDVRFGEMDLSFWPAFGLRLDDFEVAGLPEEREPVLLGAKSLRVGARLLPLLRQRLEVTSVVVDGPVVTLHRTSDGAWQPAALFVGDETDEVEEPASAGAFSVGTVRIRDGKLVARIEQADGGHSSLAFEGIAARIDGVGAGGALQLELTGVVEAAQDGGAANGAAARADVSMRGTIGPPPGGDAALPFDLAVTLDTSALEPFLSYLPAASDLDVASASLDADLVLRGNHPGKIDIGGTAALSGAKISVQTPARGRVSEPLDLSVRGDFVVDAEAGRVEIGDLVLELPRRKTAPSFTLRGAVDTAGSNPVVDLRLLPTRVVAGDVASLVALMAPGLAVSFSSTEPVEFELAVRGPVGGSAPLDVEGRAKLAGFTFRHASMLQPAERVRATVNFNNRQVTVEDLSAAIGTSDVAGRVSLNMAGAPRLSMQLSSNHADFWELFSFIAPDESSTAAPEHGAEDPLAGLVVDGSIAIASGSLRTLTFEDLRGTLRYEKEVLTLDPVEMTLYGGSFTGALVQNLGATPSTMRFQGRAADVAADPFLAANLEAGGLMSGLAGGEMAIDLQTGSPDAIVASLTGTGSLNVTDGRFAKLEVLAPLSSVAGVFGERSVRRLTGQLAGEGTPFEVLDVQLAFDDGRATYEDLVLRAPDFELRGRGDLDLATNVLQGSFALSLSDEMSRTMREEGSRAAELFWNAGTKRVELPFALSGPATAPSVSVDWEQAARGALERRITDGLSKYLGGKREEPSGDDSTPPSAPPPATALESSSARSTASAESGGMKATVTRTSWGGSFLAPDLEIEGVVEGENLTRASVVVIDAGGSEVKRIDPLPAVAAYLATDPDPAVRATIQFKIEIDGKRLLLAKSPFRLELSVHDAAGHVATASQEID